MPLLRADFEPKNTLVRLCVNFTQPMQRCIDDDRMEAINRDLGALQYHYRKEILN